MLGRAESPSKSFKVQQGIHRILTTGRLVPRSRMHGNTLLLNRSSARFGRYLPGGAKREGNSCYKVSENCIKQMKHVLQLLLNTGPIYRIYLRSTKTTAVIKLC